MTENSDTHRAAAGISTAGISTTAEPSGSGCVDCDTIDGWWFHLRRCAECGHIGCCDSSPSQHATHHAEETGHPVIASFEPGEDWLWSFTTQDFVDVDATVLREPREHPLDQPTPGPAERVPTNWKSLLN